MMQVRKAADRGHFDHGWLKTYHSFSFSEYYDPAFMAFRHLRVLNEDWVQAGEGFGTHPHKDMEIITYVLEGALQHKDSMGNGSVIKPGDVQRMTAGTGVTHSEFNASKTEKVHLLQIWIVPDQKGLKPSYEEKIFNEADKRGKLRLIASQDGREGSVTVHQSISVFASILEPGQEVTYRLGADRYGWIQVAGGTVVVDGVELSPGDGAATPKGAALSFRGKDKAEFLLFDLA